MHGFSISSLILDSAPALVTFSLRLVGMNDLSAHPARVPQAPVKAPSPVEKGTGVPCCW